MSLRETVESVGPGLRTPTYGFVHNHLFSGHGRDMSTSSVAQLCERAAEGFAHFVVVPDLDVSGSVMSDRLTLVSTRPANKTGAVLRAHLKFPFVTRPANKTGVDFELRWKRQF